MPHHLTEPLDEVVELLGARRRRHRRAQRPVGVGEVAQHHALGAEQLVVGDELPERHRPLVHLAHDRLRRQAARVDPRVGLPVDAQGGLELLGERARPGDVVERVHPVLVVHAVGLHRTDRLAPGLEALGHQDRPRVVEGGLDDADDVEGVAGCVGVEHLEHREGEGRQRLVEREPVAEVERHLERALGPPPFVTAHEVLQGTDDPDLVGGGRRRADVRGCGRGPVARGGEQLTDRSEVLGVDLLRDAVRLGLVVGGASGSPSGGVATASGRSSGSHSSTVEPSSGSTTLARSSEASTCTARSTRASRRAGSSWLSSSRVLSAACWPSHWSSTLSTIAWLTRIFEVRGSGAAATSRS